MSNEPVLFHVFASRTVKIFWLGPTGEVLRTDDIAFDQPGDWQKAEAEVVALMDRLSTALTVTP